MVDSRERAVRTADRTVGSSAGDMMVELSASKKQLEGQFYLQSFECLWAGDFVHEMPKSMILQLLAHCKVWK